MHDVTVGTDEGAGGMKISGANGSSGASEDQKAEAKTRRKTKTHAVLNVLSIPLTPNDILLSL